MLRTDERLLLSDAITPPDGSEMNLLVATTYTLHFPALLLVPLSLTFVDWEAEDGTPSDDPIAALEAVRRYSERMVVFCQAGETAGAKQPPVVASWLEDVVTPVRASRKSGVFHPKLWLLRYRWPSGRVAYRVVCASRNLSFDRSWDVACVVDGQRSPRGGLVAETAPLADFLQTLPRLVVGRMPRTRLKAVAELSDELRRVRFMPPDGFDYVAFHPLGIVGYRRDPLPASIRRLLVIAPFLGAERLTSFQPDQDDNLIVSRAEELELLSQDAFGPFSRVCTLDDVAQTDRAAPDDASLNGLHAKIYAVETGRRAAVFIGSPNATIAGFERNVEFLVELGGTRGSCGIESLLGDPQDPASLAALLVDVAPGEAPAEPDPKDALERELDGLARAVAEQRFTANVTEPVQGRFDIVLNASKQLGIPVEVRARCWPLTEPEDRYPEPIDPAAKTFATFTNLELEAVTAFFAVELWLKRSGVEAEKLFVVRAELVGAPEGRREAVVRALLQDPERVVRLLRLLLAFDPDAPQSSPGDLLGINGAPWLNAEGSLFEALLLALAEAPARVDAVSGLVDDLGEAAADVLPPGFSEVFEPIREARARRKR